MGSATLLLAVISLVPAMAGPLAGEDRGAATIALCGGGSISLPFEQGPAQDDPDAPDCAKACHGSRPRKVLDRTQ